MNKSLVIFIIAIIHFFTCSVPVFAASSNFLSKDQRYYDQNCNRRNISNETSLQCYVFDKVNEAQISLNSLTGRVTNVENKNTTQDKQILDLQTKNASQDAEIQILMDKIEELGEATPVILTLANNLNVNGPNGPSVQIPSGYKSMTIENTLSGGLNGWAPQVSFDGGSTWYEQHRFGCGGNCQVITIPILGPLYRFSPGGGSGTVTSKATLNKEPNSKVIVFGHGINYPFTSNELDTTGYSKILVTAGGGDNPQNLVRISLQTPQGGGAYGQSDSVGCDGGATCPLQEMLLQSGQNLYKVGIIGNGTNGLFGAILRP